MTFLQKSNINFAKSFYQKAMLTISGISLLAVATSCDGKKKDKAENTAEEHKTESINYAELVNAEIGNKGKGVSETELQFEAGFTFPGATYPFGMVQFTQTFFQPDKGFVVNQLSGAGCPNMGNLPTMALSGALEKSPNDMEGINPSNENLKAQAGYYQTKLSSDIQVELTATKRTGMAKFSFAEGEEEGTVVIGTGINANKMTNAEVKITGASSFEGHADGGSFCGSATPYVVYFVGEFDAEATTSGTWTGENFKEASKNASGENSGAYFTFDVSSGKPVQYKFGISYVSLENARENLKAENSNFNFDATKNEAMQAWNSYLSKIKVKGGSKDQQVQFYTHLYNSLKHPSIFSDVNGEYLGSDNKVYKAEGFDYYTAFSNWDTYRTQTQLIALLAPKVTSDVVKSHLLFAERSGGGLPRWVLANYATGIMQGDPSSALIANAYAFGATDFDKEKALKIMRHGAEEPGLKTQNVTTRTFLDQYLAKGYIYDHMGASIALEFTTADFAIGQFAKQALGNDKVAADYLKRAQYWKNLYNPKTKWLNSKNEDGSWKGKNDDWREATYANYHWMVPYNLGTLIDTMGGKKPAEQRLDSLFVKIDATYYQDWFAAGNEPDFQVPWVYNWTGSPYKTQAIVRRVLNEKYQNEASGLPGNEDLGSMGAWYVFADIGLYPMIPGVGGFSINSPVFSEVEIELNGGKTIHITGGSSEKKYINSLKVNGENWDNTWISLDELREAGSLDFELSETPNKEWGTATPPPSYDSK
ncbi:GH92 family glycosyl hydrolase [Mesonia sp.]|uniref:GH92 family glycosyl hydrolase n=1 Tax=Mesonia sp. TaxID=1960830 RepID=UPI0025C05D63|nr:GH92 family glycosyl hydrolase [Mesonia sp.]